MEIEDDLEEMVRFRVSMKFENNRMSSFENLSFNEDLHAQILIKNEIRSSEKLNRHFKVMQTSYLDRLILQNFNV